ncbi:MAG: (2Fe-2S) ferredoxin domain-containing protein [Clostridia bacterium]|nr:(2Fe-2S) ferredoxin domain-containing protein [Clostridia bacterium]
MTIYVCVGSACHLKGSYNIINEFQQIIDENGLGDQITVIAALCLGKCSNAVSVQVDDSEAVSLTHQNVRSYFEQVIKKML